MAHVPSTGSWTIDTAMAHLLALISANDQRYEERFSASQKALELGLSGTKSEISVALAASKEAVLKAENATEKRFESVNEFRGALDNQQRTLIQRSEVEAMFHGLTEKIDRLQTQADNMSAERAGVRGGWGYAAGVLGFIIGVAGLIAMLTGGM